MPWRLWGLVVAVLLIDGGSASSDVSGFLKDGDAALGRGELSAAVRLYTSAIDQGKPAPLLYTKRAAAYISLRQQAQALRDLDSAIELDESFVQGYITRGKLQRQVCNLKAAEADFQRVLVLKPSQKTAAKELEMTRHITVLLASVEEAHRAKNPAKTKTLLAKLYEGAQDCVQAQQVEVQILAAEEAWEEVVALTGKILKSEPTNIIALVLRGRAYFYLNDSELAKRHFGEALRHDPDDVEAKAAFKRVKDFAKKKLLAEASLSTRDWAAAEGQFSDALHVDQDHRKGNKELWFGLCRARYHLQRYEPAIEACEATLTLHPGHLDARVLVIRALMSLERWQDAVTKARAAASEERGNREVHQLLQECEMKLKVSLRKDYYKILDVDKSAGERDIKRAYREMAKKFHPDKVPASEQAAAEAKFRDIAEAYGVLSDEEKRQRYDSGQDIEEPQGHQGHHGWPGGGGHQHFTFQWG